jgi:hypothetical protein
MASSAAFAKRLTRHYAGANVVPAAPVIEKAVWTCFGGVGILVRYKAR